MQNIWISGSINSGKSTVAQLLGPELRMAVIELDTFSEYVRSWMPFEEYIDLNYALVPGITVLYNNLGISVIIVYPLDEKRYQALSSVLSQFTVFTLDPTLEVALTNRGERKLTDWERSRILHHYEIGIPFLAAAHRIETKNKNSDEVKDMIISYLNTLSNTQ